MACEKYLSQKIRCETHYGLDWDNYPDRSKKFLKIQVRNSTRQKVVIEGSKRFVPCNSGCERAFLGTCSPFERDTPHCSKLKLT